MEPPEPGDQTAPPWLSSLTLLRLDFSGGVLMLSNTLVDAFSACFGSKVQIYHVGSYWMIPSRTSTLLQCNAATFGAIHLGEYSVSLSDSFLYYNCNLAKFCDLALSLSGVSSYTNSDLGVSGLCHATSTQILEGSVSVVSSFSAIAIISASLCGSVFANSATNSFLAMEPSDPGTLFVFQKAVISAGVRHIAVYYTTLSDILIVPTSTTHQLNEVLKIIAKRIVTIVVCFQIAFGHVLCAAVKKNVSILQMVVYSKIHSVLKASDLSPLLRRKTSFLVVQGRLGNNLAFAVQNKSYFFDAIVMVRRNSIDLPKERNFKDQTKICRRLQQPLTHTAEVQLEYNTANDTHHSISSDLIPGLETNATPWTTISTGKDLKRTTFINEVNLEISPSKFTVLRDDKEDIDVQDAHEEALPLKQSITPLKKDHHKYILLDKTHAELVQKSQKPRQ